MTVVRTCVRTAPSPDSGGDGGKESGLLQGALTLSRWTWIFGYNPGINELWVSWPTPTPSVDGVGNDGSNKQKPKVKLRVWSSRSPDEGDGDLVFDDWLDLDSPGDSEDAQLIRTLDERKLHKYLVLEFEGTGPGVGEPPDYSPGASAKAQADIRLLEREKADLEKAKEILDAQRRESQRKLQVEEARVKDLKASHKADMSSQQARSDANLLAIRDKFRVKEVEFAEAEAHHREEIEQIRAQHAALMSSVREKLDDEKRRSVKKTLEEQAAKTREVERSLARSEDGSVKVGQMIWSAMTEVGHDTPGYFEPPPPYQNPKLNSAATEVQERVRQLVLLLQKTKGSLEQTMSKLNTAQQLREKDASEIRSLQRRIGELEGRSRQRGRGKKSSFWDFMDDDGFFDDGGCGGGDHGVSFQYGIGRGGGW